MVVALKRFIDSERAAAIVMLAKILDQQRDATQRWMQSVCAEWVPVRCPVWGRLFIARLRLTA
ncbi:hypothetical protein AAJCM20276_05740 [Acetobacter aceti]|uniref:Uncharacterized protein n=1 Tax=Acetobacter aceti TaxID=435 RepID=A0A6S6PG65_ACEAC|nr:hypothetical protein AAJCM20276_05740 [Acetobacter aceti]